jgi:hypothetical protein
MGIGGSKESNSGLNSLIKQIEKNTAKMGSVPSNIGPNLSFDSPATGGGWSGKSIAIITFSFLFILTAFLTLVHFFVTPIFEVRLGQGGFIPIPGRVDSKMFWQSDTAPIVSPSSSIGDTPFNYSLTLDIYLNNPTGFLPDDQFRIVMIRKSEMLDENAPKVKNPDTLAAQINTNYNLAVYFDKGKNDLNVSVMTTDASVETITIVNAPSRQPFRIGVVVGANYLDVYLNGRLYKSKPLMLNPLQTSASMIIGPPTEVGDIVQARQLQIWNRTLQPAELKYIIPPLATFTPSNPSDTTTCSVASSIKSSIVSSFDSAFSLGKDVVEKTGATS